MRREGKRVSASSENKSPGFFAHRARFNSNGANASRGLCDPPAAILSLLLLSSVAFLELLSATAGTGVVAAHLFTGPPLRGLARVVAPRAAGCFQFALLLAVEFFLQRVDGGGGLAGVNADLTRFRIQRERLCGRGYRRRLGDHSIRSWRRIHRLPIGSKNLHPEQEPDGVFLELFHHRLEHIEGFP